MATPKARLQSAHRPSRYEAPFMAPNVQDQSAKDRFLAWLHQAVADGEWFLKSQSGYRFVDTSHKIMADMGFDEFPSTLSKASFNFIKRDVRQLVAMLANPRPISSFKCENQAHDTQTEILNQCYMNWSSSTFMDRTLKGALQYAAVEGTGYLMVEWDPGFWGAGKGDIRLTPLGVDAVLPIQINPDTNDLQSAYAVIIRRQFPMVEVIRRFPHLQASIVPDGESSNRLRRLWNNIADKVSATVLNTYGANRGYRGEDPGSRQLVTVYDVYINDVSVNMSSEPMRMGVEGSPWEYLVPYFGQPVPIGINDSQGQPLTRPADMHDARLFPYRRHVVCTKTALLYDGPSRYWHGQVPLVRFRLDEWPFEYCGIPITKEPAKLQAMLTSLLRAYDDSANARLRPPVQYDDARLSPADADRIDIRQGGAMVGVSDMLGPSFQLLVEPSYYQMGQDILPLMEWIKERGSELIGSNDLLSVTKAGQIPSGDTIEKLEQLAGPIATDYARSMEEALRKLGDMFKSLVFEFYTARRRFHLLGPGGLTMEDYDFDPGQLVPSSLPGTTRAEKARSHMENFSFQIVPGSVYQQTQASRKLMILQLARLGLPISPYTIMEMFEIPNPGKPPNPVGTEVEKWKAWKEEELGVMIDSQMRMAQAQMQMQQEAQTASMMGQLSQAIQAAVQAPTAGGGQVGRPPSGQQTPQIRQKTDEAGLPRTTIAES